jgi:tetratricopeptide (TPR) repeat protein
MNHAITTKEPNFMRVTPLALALAGFVALAVPAAADPIDDCNSNTPQYIIDGCTKLIDEGKADNDALAIAHFNRANALDDKGDHDAALADYDQSIKLKPDYVDSYLNRGLVHVEKKDYDSAIADFNRAIALKPNFARAFYARGRAYEAKGDLQQAVAGYEEAAKLAPNNKVVQKRLAEVKQKLGQ